MSLIVPTPTISPLYFITFPVISTGISRPSLCRDKVSNGAISLCKNTSFNFSKYLGISLVGIKFVNIFPVTSSLSYPSRFLICLLKYNCLPNTFTIKMMSKFASSISL